MIAIHLTNRHLRALSVNKLHEPAALSWWDLDIRDLAEHGKAAPKLIFTAHSREAANKDCRVVGVVELVGRVLVIGGLHRLLEAIGSHTHVDVHAIHATDASHATNSPHASVTSHAAG